MKKILMLIMAVLFVASLVTLLLAFRLPSETTKQVPVLSYEQTGKFDYVTYLKPSYLFGLEPQKTTQLSNLKYPTDTVDRFQFTFFYNFVPVQPVVSVTSQVEVIARGKNADGKDTQVNLLAKSALANNSGVKFDFIPLSGFSGSDIYIDIKVYPAIRTESGLFFESFTQNMHIISMDSMLEIEPATLKHQEMGYFGILSYEQTGSLDFIVLLNKISPYGSITLQSPPVTNSSPKIMGPGQIIFTKLTDKLDTNFTYKFNPSGHVTDLNTEVGITAILENTKIWAKTLVLFPVTKKTGDFNVGFTIDINSITQLLDAIRNETGITAEAYNLTIRADVHTICQTDYGPIDDFFTATLSSPVGKGTLIWAENLTQSKTGSVQKTTTVPNKYLGLSVSGAKAMSVVFLFICLSGFVFCRWIYLKARPENLSEIAIENNQIRKKYGQRIVEATEFKSVTEGEFVNLASIEDLVKLADELGRPLIHQTSVDPAHGDIYYVLDNTTCYQYYVLNKMGSDDAS